MQEELIARGHDVKIVTPLPRGAKEVKNNGVIFIGTSADFKSPFHTTAQVSVHLDVNSLRETLEAQQFDILHFHEPWVPIMSRQVLMNSSALNIATFHAKLPETVMSKTIEKVITPYTKSVMKNLHALTAVSDAAAMYVKTITDEPIEIIPNGIDLSKYKKTGTVAVNERPMILFVGRLEKRKGVKYLVDAFAEFVQNVPAARLIIAGDGPDRSKLENIVENRNIPNVSFLGYVDEAEKQALFDEADLFCSPAPYGESFGIVLLEAMAKGVITLAGDNPGYSSVLTDRGALSLVNPKDTSHFARQLELLLTDMDLRRLWHEWAEQAVKKYEYAKVVDMYEAVYDRLMKQNAKVK